ncbi:MAG: periplasmic heavy metal sensor [Candidatus Adiutrix sp.]|nr:periplasmic heavy metal sensor [Candidatus Adiutrix sp.]
MTLKKILPVLALILLFTVSGAPALAQPADGPPGQGPARESRLSPEDRAALDGLWQDHHRKMEPLKDQLWAKSMEYDALVANPNTKPGEVRAVIDEMGKLRAQMRGERENFFGQVKAKGFGPGSGKDWRGHGFRRAGHDGFDGAYGPCSDAGRGYGRRHGGGHHWR